MGSKLNSALNGLGVQFCFCLRDFKTFPDLNFLHKTNSFGNVESEKASLGLSDNFVPIVS